MEMEGEKWKGRKVRSSKEKYEESKTEGSIKLEGEIGGGRKVDNSGGRDGER